MASLACTLHTVVSARGSENTANAPQDNTPDPVPEQRRRKPPALPSGLLALASRTPRLVAPAAGTHHYRPNAARPAHEEDGMCSDTPSRAGRPARGGKARPCEPLRLAGPGLEPGGGRTKPAPGARGPEAPVVRPSAARTRAPGRGAAPGLGSLLGVARQASGEHLSSPGPVSSPPSVSSRGGESRPEEGSKPGPGPGPAGPSSRRGARVPVARPCRERDPGPGGEPGQGARSKAPEGRGRLPSLPRTPRSPHPHSLPESIVTADFSRQLQLSNSSVNN